MGISPPGNPQETPSPPLSLSLENSVTSSSLPLGFFSLLCVRAIFHKGLNRSRHHPYLLPKSHYYHNSVTPAATPLFFLLFLPESNHSRPASLRRSPPLLQESRRKEFHSKSSVSCSCLLVRLPGSWMGRPRGGKANKSMEAAKNEDAGSGAEEVIPAYKRRGRPQKIRKDAIEDEEEEDMDKAEEDGDGAKKTVPSKDPKGAAENGGKKRRRQSKRGSEAAAEEKVSEPARPLNGFRQNGSRRKSTPRRAAEAGVQTK